MVAQFCDGSTQKPVSSKPAWATLNFRPSWATRQDFAKKKGEEYGAEGEEEITEIMVLYTWYTADEQQVWFPSFLSLPRGPCWRENV